ncbi:NADPH-dependent ferric siderophore reductase, contains FAD-binding and SIP domains [Sinosporangium album]|uniref:NADPH-dependent ferric siderophore reductase, contains FAD-binding and SIP domains n=1 Tax=Sinosporangium album TaxID=504805 RepID=A0A1G7ZQL8_9ACTN|nr:siderophore-interacting protein [Sinosporangium album]SDH10959.1 NADPH-dependent ferric siderophore reductase, contains FAD-binding and SIP domains [Sinosporangium album]
MSDDLFLAEVLRTAHVTPKMIRVTLGGDGLRGYRSSGPPDEYFKMFFPAPGEETPALPATVDGRWVYPEGAAEPEIRNYTVRRFDPAANELDVDFVVHEGGVAAPWALAARPGLRVGLSLPHGLYRPPADTTWRLILGDATALPAIGRAVEELPEDARAHVYITVEGPEERQTFTTEGHADITWLYDGCEKLLDIAESFPRPDDKGYIWAAGEAGVMREIRRHLRHTLGLPTERYCTFGYWRESAEEWQRRFQLVADQVRARVALARRQGKDAEECQDEFDDALTAAGL